MPALLCAEPGCPRLWVCCQGLVAPFVCRARLIAAAAVLWLLCALGMLWAACSGFTAAQNPATIRFQLVDYLICKRWHKLFLAGAMHALPEL